MAAFEVTAPKTLIPLRALPGQPFTGQLSFVVVNRLGRAAKVRGLFTVAEPAKQEWFSVSGEQQMADGATATFEVKISVPAGTPLATYQLQPVAAAVDDPSNASDAGPAISIQLAARQPPPKWLVPLIVAGVLVVLGVAGFVIYKLVNPGPKPPPAGACAQDADCKGEANKCVEGKCVKPKAAPGQDCREDADCVTNKCIRFACAPEDVCMENRHCAAPKVCIAGHCQLKTNGTACAGAAECASGRCLRGACRAANDCDTAADCGPNLACWQNQCRQGPIGANCRADGDCQSAHCQPATHACVQCLATPHCARGMCLNSTCVPLPRGARCTRDQDCASGECVRFPIPANTRLCR